MSYTIDILAKKPPSQELIRPSKLNTTIPHQSIQIVLFKPNNEHFYKINFYTTQMTTYTNYMSLKI